MFACLFQTISYLKSKTHQRSYDFFLQPYWLQDNLCTEVQANWWFHCTNRLFRPSSAAVKQPSSQQQNFLDDSQLTLSINLDAKKQNELTKILELVRLKTTTLNIPSTEFKFKLNLKILISLASYLQYLYNNEQEVFNAAGCNATTAHDTEFLLCSPRQRLGYLRQYLIKYWQFLTRHLVKLKQLVSVSNESADINNADPNQLNIDFIDLSNLNDSTSSSAGQFMRPLSLFEDFFKYYASVDTFFEETNRLMANVNVRASGAALDSTRRLSCLVNQQKSECVDYNDSVIKNGMLNLVLLNLRSLDSGNGLEACDKTEIEKRLADSIDLFEFMEKSLNERTRHELNSGQLKLCKQIGEILIEQRDRTTEPATTKSVSKQEKVIVLIEYLKRNIDTVFHNNTSSKPSRCLSEAERSQLSMLSLDMSAGGSGIEQLLANTSISDQIRQVNQMIKESETESAGQRSENEVAAAAAETTVAAVETVDNEKQVENERIERERLHKVEQERRLAVEAAAVNEAQQRQQQQQEQQEQQQQQQQQQQKQQEEDRVNVEQNRRMQNLIEILTKQRYKTLEMNKEAMKDGFDYVKSQLKQLKNEIGFLSQRNQRRQVFILVFFCEVYFHLYYGVN
jgi:hypothetical protein